MNSHDDSVVPPARAHAQWRQSLYTGAAGIALLHIERAHHGEGDWDTAHQWITAMTRDPIIANPYTSCLHTGAVAVAFVLHAAQRAEYRSTIDTVDGHIAALTEERLHRAYARIDSGQLPGLAEYDLIRGLTGIGAYLLHRHQRPFPLLQDVLSYLVRLTEPVTTPDGGTVPGWWTNNGPSDEPSPDWLGGHANLGIAHGIAGPLALLALAMRRGITVTGHRAAIEAILAVLDQWITCAGTRTWWPGTISLPEWRTGHPQRLRPGRPSWCYGTPGIARAQQLAGLALHDVDRAHLAEQALLSCMADERQLAQLDEVGMCHGWAGLVHTTTRVTADAGKDSQLTAYLPHLYARLNDQLEHAPDNLPAGLIDGHAGVRLAQHAYQAQGPPISGWDTCLLLGP